MRTAARFPAVPVITLPRPSGRRLWLFLLFGVVVFLTAYPTLLMFISSFESSGRMLAAHTRAQAR